jgi:DNA polymerase-3 subunit gamma/tau
LGGGKKAYIIDECHQLTGDAKDALLKTIEEPPAHVYFMLCTTDLSKMTATIRSRAKVGEFELKPLHRRDLSTLMDRVIEAEGLEISPLVMRALLAASEGIPRELLGLLEKVSTASEADALELLKHGATISEDAKSLIDCLMVGVSWPAARLVLANMKVSAEDIRRSMLGYMTKVVVGSDRPHPMALIVLDEFSKPFFSSEMENKARLALAVYQCVSRFCTKENAE